MVSGKPKILFVDTGAAFTILKHDKEFQTSDTNVNLITVTGSSIKIMGESAVTISSEKSSLDMSIILIDPQTPNAIDGLLGADFLRRTKAILEVENKTLTKKNDVVLRNEGEEEVVSAAIPVKYSSPDVSEHCQVVAKQNVTITSLSQQIISAIQIDKTIKPNSCNVFANRKVGKTPLFVPSSMDQINESTNVVMLLLVNPSPQDIVLKKGTCITHMLTHHLIIKR